MLTSKEPKSKFALKMSDGAEVRNIDDLKAHFNINALVDYFCDGTLLTWLEDRYYDEEADAVRELSRHDKQLKQKLCAIFEMDSAEQIAWRRERLERLRQYTDDEKILACVERVAFNQEDLAELLDEDVREIFLCANRFVIPLRMKNKTYIGVGKAVAVIRSKSPVDFAALNITFKGVTFDDNYKKILTPPTPPQPAPPPQPALPPQPVTPRKSTVTGSKFHAKATTTIINREGIHVRQASIFVRTALKFRSKIRLEVCGRSVDAKSILMFMSLGLMYVYGTDVTITADGSDARQAVTELVALIDSGFGE